MLLGTRVMVQCLRLVWVPMLVYISEELKMSTLATGSVMSSFSLGYLSTQIAGGIMADRYGGKPVQTMTMAIMVLAMMTAPHVADIAGASGLWVIYFHMGLFAGPQHPAYNAMVAAWFPQDELGKVSSLCEAGPVAGNLLAIVVAPTIASTYGWRYSFWVFGTFGGIWLVVWQLLSKSAPDGMPDSLGDGAGLNSATQKRTTDKPSGLPWGMARHMAVWAVIAQHMVFNSTKYFFADWMPTYFATIFHKQPQRSSWFLMFPELVGVISQLFVAFLERRALKSGLSLLETRRYFGASAFIGTGFVIFNLAMAESPTSVSALLCCLQLSLALHSCGYKANYLDITQVHQGFFMGAGNTLASVMTFLVPISVALTLERTHRDWWYVFMALVLFNMFGAFVAFRLISVKRIDEDLKPEEALIDVELFSESLTSSISVNALTDMTEALEDIHETIHKELFEDTDGNDHTD